MYREIHCTFVNHGSDEGVMPKDESALTCRCGELMWRKPLRFDDYFIALVSVYIIRRGLPQLLKTDLTVIRTRELCSLSPLNILLRRSRVQWSSCQTLKAFFPLVLHKAGQCILVFRHYTFIRTKHIFSIFIKAMADLMDKLYEKPVLSDSCWTRKFTSKDDRWKELQLIRQRRLNS